MTREKAIAILDSFPREGSTWGETIEACKMGADALRNAPHWISVEDELPKEYEDVLVYGTIVSGKEIGVDSICPVLEKGCPSEWRVFSEVTHWMPLPSPPEHFADVSKKISGSSELPNNHTKAIEKGGEK